MLYESAAAIYNDSPPKSTFSDSAAQQPSEFDLDGTPCIACLAASSITKPSLL
jgi:hypothetical protein